MQLIWIHSVKPCTAVCEPNWVSSAGGDCGVLVSVRVSSQQEFVGLIAVWLEHLAASGTCGCV